MQVCVHARFAVSVSWYHNDMRATSLLVLLGAAHAWHHAPARSHLTTTRRRSTVRAAEVTEAIEPFVARGPRSLLAAANFLADEMGDQLPLNTGVARSALFLASLVSPGSLPNPFATTRWEPCVYAARDPATGRIVGVVQTALANIALAEAPPQPRTVRFFQNVVVARTWRRRGVATSLLDFADGADLRFGAALAVEPENTAAVSLYERRGFELVENEPEREGTRLMLRPMQLRPVPTEEGASASQ